MPKENPQNYSVQIIDLNSKKLDPQHVQQLSIPPEEVNRVGDARQYPLRIAQHFQEWVNWVDQDGWFFRQRLKDREKLLQKHALILSGSGQSAFHLSRGEGEYSSEDRECFVQLQEVTRDFLAQGKNVLGICMGGQAAVHALGGELGRLPKMENGATVTEAGWLNHRLTEDAALDPVFAPVSLPGSNFWAPHLHSDYVRSLPEIGSRIETNFGVITIKDAYILAYRMGYLGRSGMENTTQQYIHASAVVVENRYGEEAILRQIQPHPEMAAPGMENFLVRQNPWVANDMGDIYYADALRTPANPDRSIAQIIPRFIRESRSQAEMRGSTFSDAVIAHNLFQYLIP